MKEKKIGFIEAFSIGVGGMVGGGIFAVLGLTIDLAKGAAPIAFAVAGFIALVTAYSYVKLSLRYPSEGGSIEFIVQAFGNGLFSSIINNLLLISYVIMLALYAYAFGSYGSALIMGDDVMWVHKALAAGIILFFMTINMMGAFLTGRAEDIMVFAKLAILAVFAAVGTSTIDMTHMAPQEWMPMPSVLTGGLIIFLAYEGFELIANTARDVENPEKTLPKAYYSAVIFVIILYIWIAMVTVGNVSFEEAKKAQDYVLAVAAEPFFGKAGFIVIGIAALLSTASAINATLYGGGRTSYLIARYGELPNHFERKFKNGYEGMIIIALLGIIFATSFSLDNISVAGSFGFLVVFSLVNFANFKLYRETGGNRLISGFGTLLGLSATGVLIGYNMIHSPASLITSGIVIFAVFVFSFTYYHLKKKRLAPYLDKALEVEEESGEKR
ncbi:APC family permease [Sulfurovum sp. NBC37-1]|uniref:APC family permease n=1 Tax=Sulfurovum sp. (strain NBC37-1) TaxID=387093 RepID=UPI0001587870|nr:APC family permease [Sulfurovum sp. NBC37-1]BAF71991.1 amino acid transporter [Sulfurovum sp. NBC37-1]